MIYKTVDVITFDVSLKNNCNFDITYALPKTNQKRFDIV